MTQGTKKEKRRPIVSGMILLGLGLFLQFADMAVLAYTWPVFIIIVGAALIFGAMFRKNSPTNGTPPPPPNPGASS